MLITSVSNPRVKAVVRLQTKSSQRRREGLFCIETRRELERAIAAGFEVVDCYVCPELYRDDLREIPGLAAQTLAGVTESVLRKMAYRQHPQGFVAVVRAKSTPLGKAPRGGLTLVLSALEKPGNIGAILRSADAAGVRCVMIDQCDFDLFNPNTIRSSTGAVFSLPIVSADRKTLIDWFKQQRTPIVTLSPDGAVDYTQAEWGGERAVVLGAEATGVEAAWRDAADLSVSIPMRGRTVDSLNVSVAAAVILFHAVQCGGDSAGDP